MALDGLWNRDDPRQEQEDAAPVWAVGALCRAVADALDARFNPVRVVGEISGFTRAASGHCYFALKDANGQLRCAMFRRAAAMLAFQPRDGDRVEVMGRLGVYEPRGELQLVVESMRPAGQGALMEQFLRLKAELEAQGLFAAARKRALPPLPKGIGIVTSLGAAALHDVATALQRRVPHIPVVVAPASVQGQGAPAELVQALTLLYQLSLPGSPSGTVVDVILLVRGGGSLEDLWAFNDPALAHCMARSPVPIVCGVGHETDFTIADFVADLRAPTPTAAAELVSMPRDVLLEGALNLGERLQSAALRFLDGGAQGLDWLATRMGRPSQRLHAEQLELVQLQQRLAQGLRRATQTRQIVLERHTQRWDTALDQTQRRLHDRLERVALRLDAVDPGRVLQRGYTWITRSDGQTLTSVSQVAQGDALRATLTDGVVDLRVANPISD